MPDQNTITRPEICALLEIKTTKLVNMISYSNIQVPEPVGKKHHQLLYDRQTILDWIATKPLENIIWQERPKKPSATERNSELVSQFLSGGVGVSKTQRKRQQVLRTKAQQSAQPTQRVEVRGGTFDWHGDQRSARHHRKAQ